MGERSRPEFVASDQHLDGSNRPVAATAVREESEDAPPESAKRGRPARMALLGGAVAALLVGGAAFWAVVVAGRPDDDPEKGRFTSLPDLCASVKAETLERYVPRAGFPRPDGPAKPDEQNAGCEWTEPTYSRGVERLTVRTLRITARLRPDEASAKAEYASSWQTAQASAGTQSSSLGDIHAEAPNVVGGVGDETFVQPRRVTDGFGRSGKVTTTTRLSNIVLVVDYQGATYPTDSVGAIDMERATPLDENLARAATRAIAQDLVVALAQHG